MASDTATAQHEQHILECWHQNAGPWTDAIRNAEIASRVLATNHAVEAAVLATRPASVLDVGCGEGWLVRRMLALGIPARGLDVIPALVDSANAQGGEFAVASYEDIAAGRVAWQADTVSCNFALIGEERARKRLSGEPA